MNLNSTKIVLVAGLALALTACNNSDNSSSTPVAASGPAPVPNTAVAAGFKLSVWAQAPACSTPVAPATSCTWKPDSIIQLGNSVYIGYQKSGDVKDGSAPVTNEVVQYDLNGNALKTYNVSGHVDGLMAKDNNTLWAMANEDGNPMLTTINLSTGAQVQYTAAVNPTAHGGGFDDMQQNSAGTVFVSASNPSSPGSATAPTVVSLTLNACPTGTGCTFAVAQVLAGNATAVDMTPSVGGSANPNYKVSPGAALALTDPDSETWDNNGNLVLDSQADGKLVFISNPGAGVNQTVTVLSLTLYNDKDGPTTPVDDTRWVPLPGPTSPTFMLFTDSSNTTYRVDGPFKQGDAYSAGQGQVMQLDESSGHLTPFVAGIGVASALQDPHGMLFVTQ